MQGNSYARRVFSTRSGTIAVGVIAAAIAAILLLVYVSRYRHSVNARNATVSVLVAKNLIQTGTPGNLIGTKALYQAAAVPKNQLKLGAITDPSTLAGLVATRDIFPGQQLTSDEFGVASANSATTSISGYQRAIAIPVDATHGLVGTVVPGDHVDVMVGLGLATNQPTVEADGDVVPSGSQPVIKTILQNILVLGITGSSATLRVNDQQAAVLGFASDNGRTWLILRPPANARQSRPRVVTQLCVIFGPKDCIKPSGGGR